MDEPTIRVVGAAIARELGTITAAIDGEEKTWYVNTAEGQRHLRCLDIPPPEPAAREQSSRRSGTTGHRNGQPTRWPGRGADTPNDTPLPRSQGVSAVCLCQYAQRKPRSSWATVALRRT